ncbi:hypothetical protein GOB57_08295 [Sinorhizobium meliloti]|nr:hypothetical protein [Sinorhizobium meliloti]
MPETTFHLMDAATGRFLRQYGGSDHTRAYLSVDGDGPAYSTPEIVDIHRLMRLEQGDRTPYGLPVISHVEDEFYCVAAVKRYGSVVPGGDTVLLSTDLVKVELETLRTTRIVPSRNFAETPRILLKSYLPGDVLARIGDMKPEFLVINGNEETLATGEFVLAEEWSVARIGEVVHSIPLPESWPLAPTKDEDGLLLILVDFAPKEKSYRMAEITLEEHAASTVSPRPRTL